MPGHAIQSTCPGPHAPVNCASQVFSGRTTDAPGASQITCIKPAALQGSCSGEQKAKAFIQHAMYTVTTCIQARHSYRLNLHTGTTCIRAQPAYGHNLHTGTTFIRAQPEYRHDIHTGTTCTQERHAYEAWPALKAQSKPNKPWPSSDYRRISVQHRPSIGRPGVSCKERKCPVPHKSTVPRRLHCTQYSSGAHDQNLKQTDRK